LLAIVAAAKHLLRRESPASANPAVSILKPLYGLDEGFYTAIRSHVVQQYPGSLEILFGVRNPDDPAAAEVLRLAREFPDTNIHLVVCSREAPNPKVGVLSDLARHARHPVIVVNDSDICVDPDYLQTIVAALSDEQVGVVTCLYRATARSAAGRWEALGIASDFAPGVLVAPLVGVREFGLGATLAFRAEDLRRAGGFEGIEPYLADDYQLAKRITSSGKRTHLSRTVVETSLGSPDWLAVWKHQVRWARTIRVSRRGGYAGLPITYAGLWAVLAVAVGMPALAIGIAAGRVASAFTTGWLVLRSRYALAFCWAAPVWDLWAFAVWLAGWGRTVEWRRLRFRLESDGRIGSGPISGP
jgi:ceramide glucosyltransferase